MLKDRKIIITAGPTWVAIDKVRIITNIFNGRTGCTIAKRAREFGAQVKLLLGPGKLDLPRSYFKGVKIVSFRYFQELLSLVRKEVATKKYDVMIHSAAVSDYEPVKIEDKKIRSGRNRLNITLKPTIRIIQQIKEWDPKIFLIQFKLEVNKTSQKLIEEGYKSMLRNKADLVVVNDLVNLHNAYVVDLAKDIIKINNRSELADKLLMVINTKLLTAAKR